VYDEIAVILKDPFGVIVSFDADRQFAPILHLQVDLVTDRLILSGVVASAD
jgi:hypothetical protein